MNTPALKHKKVNKTDLTDHEQSKKEKFIFISLLIGLVCAAVISLGVGHFYISVQEVLQIFGSWLKGNLAFLQNPAEVVIFLVRIPRILLCILVGISMSAAGAAFQGLFKNPMVSPDVLGVTTGAGVGASIALLMDANSLTVQAAAFLSGLGAVFLVMTLSSLIGRGNPPLLIMVLAGMVVSSLFSSLNALIKYVADSADKLSDITFWLLGSFAKNISYKNVLILFITTLLGLVPLYLLRWKINVLSFGEEEAQAIGVDTRKMRITIIACSTLLTASCTAMCGMIGWVGLIIPHMARLLVGPNYKVLLPTCTILGALFLVIVDDVARTIVTGELPIGVITSLIGAPLFIYLMFKGRKGWV